VRIVRILIRITIIVLFAVLAITAAKSRFISEVAFLPRFVAGFLALSFVVDTLLLHWICGRGATACMIASFYVNLFATSIALFSTGQLRYYLTRMLSHQVSGIGAPTVGTNAFYEGALLLLLTMVIKTLLQSIVLRLELMERLSLRDTGLFLAVDLIVMGVAFHNFWWPHQLSVIE